MDEPGLSDDIISLRDLFAAIDSARFEFLPLYFTEDVVYERPGYESICGLNELDHFYRNVRVVAEGRHEFSSIVVSDDAAACWGRFVGSARDGSALDERFADVYHLRDGKIYQRTTYFFRAAM